MFLNFLFNHLNLITLVIWLLFSAVVILRFLKPKWLGNISYFKLILIAVGINILYGVFITWGQYYVWQNGGEMTRFLLSSPISDISPLPKYLEWTRGVIFGGKYGYFLYYVLGRTWLNIFLSFLASGVVYVFLKMWRNYKGNLVSEGPEIFLLLTLIVKWPNVLMFIPLGFFVAVIVSIIFKILGKKTILIEPVFIFILPFILIFENILFKSLQDILKVIHN